MAGQRLAIVGAGVFGLAAALELALRGHHVTVLEQGQIPAAQAASNDVSKSIQRFYDQRDDYIELAERAGRQWQAWQQRLHDDFYRPHGLIEIVRRFTPGEQRYASWQRLTARGAQLEVLTATEARRRWPALRFNDDETCLYDAWGGYLTSGRAITGLATLARAAGVELRPLTPVLGLAEHADGVSLRLAAERLTVERTIIATGVWLGQLVPTLAPLIRITRQQMAFFRPGDGQSFADDRFPTWGVDADGENWYGHPLLAGGIIKIAYNQPGEVMPPDGDREPTADFLALAAGWVGQRLPALSQAPLIGGRSCYYDTTPDRDFIIDWVPGSRRLLAAGGGSGHGFKFGGSLGPVIADALEERDHPLGSRFRLAGRLGDRKELVV